MQKLQLILEIIVEHFSIIVLKHRFNSDNIKSVTFGSDLDQISGVHQFFLIGNYVYILFFLDVKLTEKKTVNFDASQNPFYLQ